MKARYFKKLMPLVAVTEMESGDALLIYNQLEESFHALNRTAKIIWFNAAAAVELEEFAQALEKRIVASQKTSTIFDDLEKFIFELSEYGLLTEEVKLGRQEDVRREKLFHGITLDQYEPPVMQTYTKEWMKENHPDVFYKLQRYGDFWSPETSGNQ